jgi:hypothetical protein
MAELASERAIAEDADCTADRLIRLYEELARA